MLVLFLNMSSYKKTESLLTNFIVYDLETHNTDRGRPYCIFLSIK